MASLVCTCGHRIRFNTENLPFYGRILKDQDADVYFAGVAKAMALFVECTRTGDWSEWEKTFHWLRPGEGAESIAYSLQSWYAMKYFVTMYECEQCGRLWVHRRVDGNEVKPYSPDQPGEPMLLPSEHFRRERPAGG